MWNVVIISDFYLVTPISSFPANFITRGLRCLVSVDIVRITNLALLEQDTSHARHQTMETEVVMRYVRLRLALELYRG